MYLFEEKIEKILCEERIVGASVALTNREKTLFTRGYGVRDILTSAPVKESTVFRIASITKVVTGILTMRFAEDGLIDLDDPVKSYLPWLTLSDKSAERSITVRMLMSHTAGLPMEYTPEGPLDEGQLVPSLMEGLPTLALASVPGEGRFLYSNWGIRLLSAVIEAVSGERYSESAKRLVLDPLGMKDSRFMLESGVDHELAYPHEPDGDGVMTVSHQIKENYCRLATGGLYSNSLDLCRLGRAILSGGVADDGTRVVKTESIEAMMMPHATMRSGDKYGLTMMIHNLAGRVVYGHNGNANPYTSSLYVDPVSGYGAVVLLNSPNEQNLRVKIADAMLSEFI